MGPVGRRVWMRKHGPFRSLHVAFGNRLFGPTRMLLLLDGLPDFLHRVPCDPRQHPAFREVFQQPFQIGLGLDIREILPPVLDELAQGVTRVRNRWTDMVTDAPSYAPCRMKRPISGNDVTSANLRRSHRPKRASTRSPLT
jgi:hypothetical protein